MLSWELRQLCCSLENTGAHGPPNGGQMPRPMAAINPIDAINMTLLTEGGTLHHMRAINMTLLTEAKRFTMRAISMTLLREG